MRRLRSLFASLALFVAPSMLTAQVGPVFQVSYAKQFEAVGVGAGYGFRMGEMTTSTGIWGQATFDYFFVDKFHSTNPVPEDLSHSYYEFNLQGIKVIGKIPGLYVGAGVNYSTEKINSGDYRGDEGGANLGVSVMGGFHFGPWHQALFVQARNEFGGGKQFVVSAGIAF